MDNLKFCDAYLILLILEFIGLIKIRRIPTLLIIIEKDNLSSVFCNVTNPLLLVLIQHQEH